MKRKETIKKQSVFNNLIHNGKYIKNTYFIIYNEKIDSITNNYGIAISNKVGNAVTRNKLKRQTRSIIDNNRNLFKNGYNYIIMIRKACTNVKYSDLENAFIKLLEK